MCCIHQTKLQNWTRSVWIQREKLLVDSISLKAIYYVKSYCDRVETEDRQSKRYLTVCGIICDREYICLIVRKVTLGDCDFDELHSTIPPNGIQPTYSRLGYNVASFSQFSRNYILFQNDFLLIELVDGHVVARFDLGNGEHSMRSKKKYNNGEWIDLRFSRLEGRGKCLNIKFSCYG